MRPDGRLVRPCPAGWPPNRTSTGVRPHLPPIHRLDPHHRHVMSSRPAAPMGPCWAGGRGGTRMASRRSDPHRPPRRPEGASPDREHHRRGHHPGRARTRRRCRPTLERRARHGRPTSPRAEGLLEVESLLPDLRWQPRGRLHRCREAHLVGFAARAQPTPRGVAEGAPSRSPVGGERPILDLPDQPGLHPVHDAPARWAPRPAAGPHELPRERWIPALQRPYASGSRPPRYQRQALTLVERSQVPRSVIS